MASDVLCAAMRCQISSCHGLPQSLLMGSPPKLNPDAFASAFINAMAGVALLSLEHSTLGTSELSPTSSAARNSLTRLLPSSSVSTLEHGCICLGLVAIVVASTCGPEACALQKYHGYRTVRLAALTFTITDSYARNDGG